MAVMVACQYLVKGWARRSQVYYEQYLWMEQQVVCGRCETWRDSDSEIHG